jgi:hypothetical protein
MTPLEIAKYLIDEVTKTTARKGTKDDLVNAVAKLCAKEFPDTDREVIGRAIELANDILGKEYDFKIRRIEPIGIVGLDIASPENGEPICERVNPAMLYVDPAYQRNIGARGLRQIKKIVESFDWNRFKPPICCYAEAEGQTVLKVLDGQHTAIACASHPEIDFIPIMIVEAPHTFEQAAAFVGQNTERLQVTPLQLHQSALVARDLDALTVDIVCKQAGVTILRTSTNDRYKAGETISVNAIQTLINTHGNEVARDVLTVLARARFAPILKPQIKAVELLMTNEEYCNDFKVDDLVTAIYGSWPHDQDAAKQLAITHKWTFWKALAIVWYRKVKKNRTSVGRAA